MQERNRAAPVGCVDTNAGDNAVGADDFVSVARLLMCVAIVVAKHSWPTTGPTSTVPVLH